MRKLLALVAVLFAGVGVAFIVTRQSPQSAFAASNPVLLGDTNVEPFSGGGFQTSEAFGYTASQSGTSSDVMVYLTSTTGVRVGVYSSTNGRPGARLATGAVTSNTAGWTDVPIAGVSIKAGVKYWLAIAANTGTAVAYRDVKKGGSGDDFQGSGLDNPYSVTKQKHANPASIYLTGVPPTPTTTTSSTTTTPTTTSTTTTTTTTTTTPVVPPTTGLHVVGNHLEDAGGATVVLHGTFLTGPSYACEQNGGYGFSDTPTGDTLYGPMVSDAGGKLPKPWPLNSVELLLNQDCWLGINGVASQYSSANYQNFVKAQVASIEKYGMYPVLTFGEGAPSSQQPDWNATDTGEAPMPNADHMPLAFQQLADMFKDDPKVVLRLYQEPWPNNNNINLQTWKCWAQGDVQYGGSLTPTSQTQNCNETYRGTAYKTVGMQSLLNIIRGTGATNVVQVPGVSFANMLSCSATTAPTACGFLDAADGIKVNDTLATPQLMADTDNYPDVPQYCGDLSCVTTTYGPVKDVMPIDMGEIGVLDNTKPFSNAQAFIGQFDAWHQSYYGSQWETWAPLISNYDGTPAANFGLWFYNHVAGASYDPNPPPPPPPTPAGSGQMPFISRGLPAYSSQGGSGCGGSYQQPLNGDTNSLLNNSDYTEKAATCFGFLSQGSYPSWVAYNLSSLPAVTQGKLTKILSTWINAVNYNYDFATWNTGDSGSMRDYTIDVACQNLATTTVPTSGWVTRVNVTGNTLHSRSHVIDMVDPNSDACNGSYNWIRLNVTKGNQWANWQGKWELWDATQSLDDSWFFAGDSIMANIALNRDADYGQTFAKQINASRSQFYPSVENGGMGGWTATGYLQDLTAKHTNANYPGGDSTPWLPKIPAHYFVVALGTNDCNGGNDANYERDMTGIVDAALAADPTRVVILPTLPASPYLRSGTNMVLVWNGSTFASTQIAGGGGGPYCDGIIQRVIAAGQAKYGASHVLAGPDIWAATVIPDSHWGDGLHPAGDAKGEGLLRSAWVKWAEDHVYNSG